MKVPFLRPDIRPADLTRLEDSIKSGWLAPGPCTELFERELSSYLNAKHAVFLNSCTSALHLALMLAGVKEGDEVITTPMSYVATSNAILYLRATPVFVDVDPGTGLMDLDKVKKAITAKTKAIVPVHLYGQMVDMNALSGITKDRGIKIIEDAAHALESERDGVCPGQLSFAACFSFHAAKNITSGQGGALVTNDGQAYERAKILRRDGVINIEGKRRMVDFGYKYDTADFQAAMLLGQLKRIKSTRKRRQNIFDAYVQGFQGRSSIGFPAYETQSGHSGHLFVVWVDLKKRDRIRKLLEDKGVSTSIHYEPIHLEPYYRKAFGFKEGDYPVAEKMGAATISLPTFSLLKKKEQDYVIKSLISCL